MVKSSEMVFCLDGGGVDQLAYKTKNGSLEGVLGIIIGKQESLNLI